MCLHRKDASMEWWQVVDNQDRENHQHSYSYQLAGYSLHQGNHFTCMLFYNGRVLLQWPKGYRQITINSLQKFKRKRLARFQR